MSEILFESLAFALASFGAAKTTELKKPIMAITTRSSSKVKPFLKFINYNISNSN